MHALASSEITPAWPSRASGGPAGAAIASMAHTTAPTSSVRASPFVPTVSRKPPADPSSAATSPAGATVTEARFSILLRASSATGLSGLSTQAGGTM
ncbi:MAG: hypothetical protein JRG91_14735, partial [Deltaproteobacteria bacterium]|nr:hypothetical protein [Deltaproteobacteria bacterium]